MTRTFLLHSKSLASASEPPVQEVSRLLHRSVPSLLLGSPLHQGTAAAAPPGFTHMPASVCVAPIQTAAVQMLSPGTAVSCEAHCGGGVSGVAFLAAADGDCTSQGTASTSHLRLQHQIAGSGHDGRLGWRQRRSRVVLCLAEGQCVGLREGLVGVEHKLDGASAGGDGRYSGGRAWRAAKQAKEQAVKSRWRWDAGMSWDASAIGACQPVWPRSV